jgi:hypothetical protein
MIPERRGFLKKLAGGLAAIFGFLFSRKAEAGPRRQWCPQPAPGYYPCHPVGYGVGQINVDWPPTGTPMQLTQIPGGGGFCVWGSASNVLLGTLNIQVFVNGTQVGSATALPFGAVAPCQWGYGVTGVGPAGTQVVKITVSGIGTDGQPVSGTADNLQIAALLFPPLKK